MDAETAKAIQDKQAQLALKKQIIASDSVLKDFNWNLYMPLDQSSVVKSGSAIIDHSLVREVSALQRDVRAPFVEVTFQTQRDDQARQTLPESDTHQVAFSKVQLQQFFEELEKIQIRLDELS